MSNDKNNIAVVNTTDIVHLINELRILNATTLHNLSSANGLIPQLNENITILNGKNNLKKAQIIQEERIKNDAENAQKKLSDNLQHLDKILNEFKIFEKAQEQLLTEQAGKIVNNFANFEISNKKMFEEQTKKTENLKDNLELRAEIWISQFQENLSLLKNELEIQISKKLKDVDLKKFEDANKNVKDAIKNFDDFHQKMEKSYLKNNILTGIMSFVGGATVMALVFFFLK